MHVSKRITFVEKEHLQLDLEYNDHFAILHLPLMKMSRSSYTDLMAIIPQLYQFLNDTGNYEAVHAAIDPTDKTMAKLVDRLGFNYLGQSPAPDKWDIYEYRGES